MTSEGALGWNASNIIIMIYISIPFIVFEFYKKELESI